MIVHDLKKTVQLIITYPLLKIGIVVDEEGTVKKSYSALDETNDIDLLDDEDIVISNNSNECITHKKLISYDCPEAKVEKYLISNLDLIEKGMQYINCQYSVENGFVDIMAKDIKGNKCIIEVKNNPYNKDICFQSLYYPQTIEGNTRMIVINSDYQNRILKALKQIGNIEIYKYGLTLNDKNEISDFNLQRVI
ncbi:Endonuclease NucS [bioreactor metagenome]|uniref:Endonuclease NucS n=1 Tax=bioreactor metagenome TaxID=1076179 RepID=A0A644ZT58_9ZZZZ